MGTIERANMMSEDTEIDKPKMWHINLHVEDDIRIKVTIKSILLNKSRSAVIRDILTDALADVDIPREFRDPGPDDLIED